MDIPTVGVEEEFLLVHPATGEPAPRNAEVARHAAALGIELQLELTSCQVETATEATSSSSALRDELVRLRRAAADAAESSGTRLLAVALPPTVPHEFPITAKPRYQRIAQRFGMIAHEQGICGCHVHVAVPDRATAIDVSNRLRPYLPLLLALTANSAIYRNTDTGYASWRSILWARWPSAGPPPRFSSPEEYDACVAMMEDTDAMLDDGMVYWDVRPSAKFPTVEIRVADVPATVAETVLYATIVRAAVMTVLDESHRGTTVPEFADHVLKAAYWKAARDGIDGTGIDIVGRRNSVPVGELVTDFVSYLQPALQALGDDGWVRSELDRVLSDGNGAMRQRRAWQRNSDIEDVLAEAAEATLRC